jgi:lipoate-protein ligase A
MEGGMSSRNGECEMMNDESQDQQPVSIGIHHSSLITHHSSFQLLLDPPAAGAWNMAVDETLLEAAADDGQCTLRFYQWAEPTLSLGYFQACADRAGHEASRHSAVVRRASGGGAIMHDIDVTYSLAVPDRHPLAAGRLHTYRIVHNALIEVLAALGIQASLFGCDAAGCGCGNASSPTPLPPAMRREPFLCFQRRAAGDVLVKGEKVAGSAQRRCRGAVLQHGSVLLARSAAAPELDGLKELTDKTFLVEEFIQAWLQRLSASLAIRWRKGGLSDAQRRRVTQLVAEKYGSPAWTNAR